MARPWRRIAFKRLIGYRLQNEVWIAGSHPAITRLLRGIAGLILLAIPGMAQTDPGPRGGVAAAGGPIAGLTAAESDFFSNNGLARFNQIDAVADGLGPRFNLDSCSGCHFHPAPGGSSPASNPQFTRAGIMAPGNAIPSFVRYNGPIRVARFIRQANGSPDGGVHDIFTIAGRSDAPAGCAIKQPDFDTQQFRANLAFRIPTPIFGAGLIEAIPDKVIKDNLASDPGGLKAQSGIKGRVNTNGNDGTVTRFGWKAQNKSLLIFSGEAYNVEMGVTSEIYPNERDEDPDCATNATAESRSEITVGNVGVDDTVAIALFMKFLDAPAPVNSFGQTSASSIIAGRGLFVSTGCSLCHTPSLSTGASSIAALSHKQANLFSDLAIHRMGSNLADGITQGSAGPDEFRTAPLWGLGQRLFFLHDGRTSDLLEAVEAHRSHCGRDRDDDADGCSPSEANKVIRRFDALTAAEKQDLLNFLRSL